MRSIVPNAHPAAASLLPFLRGHGCYSRDVSAEFCQVALAGTAGTMSPVTALHMGTDILREV